MRLFKILWSYKVLLPPNFALTGLHTLYTSLDCILDLQLKIKNFKVDKYSLKNFHQMTQHHQDGWWEAWIAQDPGTKYYYLGTFGPSSTPWFLMSVCLNSMHFQG
jgi:hypothetical protein